MTRMMWTAPLIVGGLVLCSALPASAAQAQQRMAEAPGCSVQTFTANHLSGNVSWTITCDADRDVVVDATAFRGTSDDHVIVDEQTLHGRVLSGGSWTGNASFDTEGVDQIRAQALTFVDINDPFERPAIIGGAQG